MSVAGFEDSSHIQKLMTRWTTVCIIQDPATKRRHPRGYIESLEQHVAFLERHLRDVQPGIDIDRLTSLSDFTSDSALDVSQQEPGPTNRSVSSHQQQVVSSEYLML